MAATPKAVKSIKDLADTKAPIESPSLTGTPTAPTAAQGTNSTQIANTAFVKAAITALINGAPGTLDTLKEIAAAINNDPNFREGANKRGNSSRLTQSFHFFMFEPIFSPVNALNQPI